MYIHIYIYIYIYTYIYTYIPKQRELKYSNAIRNIKCDSLSASSNKRKASMEAALNSVWPKWFQNTRPWCQNIRLPGHQLFRNVNGSAHVTFAKSQTTARLHVWFLIRRNIFMCDSWFDVTHMLRKSKKSKSNQDSHMSTRHKISHDPPRVMSKTWTWKVGGWKRLFLLGCTGWLWARCGVYIYIYIYIYIYTCVYTRM